MVRLRFLVCVCLTPVPLVSPSRHLCLRRPVCVSLNFISRSCLCPPPCFSFHVSPVCHVHQCVISPTRHVSPSLRVSSPLTVSMFPCLFVSPPYVSPDCLVPMYVPSFWPWCLSLCFILTVYRPVFSVFSFAFPISYAYSFQLCSHAFPLSLFSLSVYILSLSPSVPCRCIRLHSLMSPWYFQVFNSI